MAKGNIAVIPARGGSKRIPGKNIKELVGKPLLAYSVQAAIDSNLFDRVIVSTDSREIAQVAKECGAEVPFLRDDILADEYTPVSAATADAVYRLDPYNTSFSSVAQLMPCCPLRTAHDVQESFNQFESTGAYSQISVVGYGWQNPWWAMQQNERHELEPLFEQKLASRSQDLPTLFCPTGAIWWARTALLLQTRSFHVQGRTGWEIPWQRGIDIDTLEDFLMAEVLMKCSPTLMDFGFGQAGSILG
jgi:pseudaminic acid cytidylyltransferase